MMIFVSSEVIDNIEIGENTIESDSEIIHYLFNVLRIKRGEKIILNSIDNTVNNYKQAIAEFEKIIDKNKIKTRVITVGRFNIEFPVIDVFIVPLKSRYFEDSIEHISQLPINSIFLIKSKFISTNFQEIHKKIERLKKIIYWNTIYVRKHFLTNIKFLDQKLEDTLKVLSKKYAKIIAFDHRTNQEINADILSGRIEKMALMIGPEGGWAKEEIDLFTQYGQVLKFKNIDVGLKAEIAPLVGISQILGFINK
ncbi:MAG: RsmE family RNA methyltransferase [Candidatus Calescibacterium sp.]|nr:RsmE family RNA methyltransferase [Candidatus Calescibacterium sp.]MDW8133178.1 RsmE family RNA methyltransferase [Candidatus Calescibacterium sp.]